MTRSRVVAASGLGSESWTRADAMARKIVGHFKLGAQIVAKLK
jgi:hypothetical protein